METKGGDMISHEELKEFSKYLHDTMVLEGHGVTGPGAPNYFLASIHIINEITNEKSKDPITTFDSKFEQYIDPIRKNNIKLYGKSFAEDPKKFFNLKGFEAERKELPLLISNNSLARYIAKWRLEKGI